MSSPEEWRLQHAWSELDFHGRRIQRLTRRGAPVKAVRAELELYGFRCGRLALQAGISEKDVRDYLLDVAGRCGDPCAGAAVMRGLRQAVRQLRVRAAS